MFVKLAVVPYAYVTGTQSSWNCYYDLRLPTKTSLYPECDSNRIANQLLVTFVFDFCSGNIDTSFVNINYSDSNVLILQSAVKNTLWLYVLFKQTSGRIIKKCSTSLLTDNCYRESNRVFAVYLVDTVRSFVFLGGRRDEKKAKKKKKSRRKGLLLEETAKSNVL